MPTGLGVDVHPYYQRGARFTGVEYAWVKMTDGTRVYTKTVNNVTYRADTHAATLRAERVPFGGYCYAQPGDGGDEAQVLWNECLRLGGTGVAPAIDIESDPDIHTWSTREAIDHGRAFCSAMRRIGVRPAVYMNDSLAGATQPDSWPEDPVLWIARYGGKPQRSRYDVHQYTSSGSLLGSAGAVDWNQSYTTAHLLATTPEDDMPLTDADAQLVAKHIWYDPIWSGPNADGKTRWQLNPSQVLAALDSANKAEAAKVDALIATVAALSTDTDLTVDSVRQIVTDAVAQHINITGTVQITPKETP